MSQVQTLRGLNDIAESYDAILCDAWGVIHNGQRLFPGVAEALTKFRQTRGPVIILTNAPRLSDVIPPQLDKLGLPQDAYDAIVTSGDATKAAVEARSDQRFYRLGPNKDDTLFNAMASSFVPLEDAEIILCTGLLDDLNETPEDYREMLSGAAARQLPMICANPDKVVKFGDRLMYCAGALGDLYESLGGEVILCGKPHAPIYEVARRRLSALRPNSSMRLLAIGDGLQTDILGANQQDIDVVFIADGIFSEDARGPNGALDGQRLEGLLDQYQVHARYGMDGLSW